MKPHLVDFHCHLDLFPDFPSAVREAEAAQVFTLAVTTTPKAWPRNLELTRDTKHVRAALGLHPQLVAERSSEIDLWESYLPGTRYVGEVGIDASRPYASSVESQKRIFERILRSCAAAGGKVLTVHSVRSTPIVLDMIDALLPSANGRVVMHWFTGSQRDACRAVDLGCYFSVNMQMMVTDKGRMLLNWLPVDRVLTETDGPFTSQGDRPSRPADVAFALENLASLRKLPLDEMAEQVESNLRRLLET